MRSYTLGANFPASLLLMFLFCLARCHTHLHHASPSPPPPLTLPSHHALTVSLNFPSNSFIYLAEKAFSEPSLGQIILLTSFIFFGLGSLVVMLLLLMFWWLPALQEAREVLEVLLLIFPPYALGRWSNAFTY